jgi:hypothetical protein
MSDIAASLPIAFIYLEYSKVISFRTTTLGLTIFFDVPLI